MRTWAAWLAIVFLVGAKPAPAEILSQDAALDTFLRRAQFRAMQLSPSGRYLAAISPSRGRYNLALLDLEKREVKSLSTLDNTDVIDFAWLSDDRITYAVGDSLEASGASYYRGRFIVDADGNRPRRVDDSRGFTIVSTYTGKPDEIIVASLQRTRDSWDLYRYDTRGGRFTEMLTFDSPGFVQSWVLDRDYVPRVAISRDPADGKTTVWYREGRDAKWREFWSDVEDKDHARPIAFDFDGKTMYVSSNVGGDRRAIYEWDFERKALGKLVASHPEADVNGLIFDVRGRKLLGFRAEGDRPFVQWFDPEKQALQKMVDGALPNTWNTLLWAADKPAKMMVFARSDRDPGTYYLFDPEKKRLEHAATSASWIDPARTDARKPVRYKARDGLEIPAYLTLPSNATGRKVPLVVHVHGGPNVRGNTWGFDPLDAMFASQGYAVLSPNFRGTTGLGAKLYRAGFKQWGLSMQDDLVDGAKWLVDQGLVDPARICIVGASYGGYATLYGVARDPDFWRCGVAWVGVSDISLLFDVTWSDTARSSSRFLDNEARYRIGDPKRDAEQFRKTSAVENAQRIKAPLLLAYGSEDVRVPLIHGEKMRAALDTYNKPYEWVVYTGEGHGFNKDENRRDFFKRTLTFLRKHLQEPPAPASAQ